MVVSSDALAEIDRDDPWATLALALATGATFGEKEGWPPTLGALTHSTWSFRVTDPDGEELRWSSARLDIVSEHVAALLRDHGVTATELRYFAEDDPRILVAAFSPGDADAVLHEVRIYGGGRELYCTPDLAAGVEPWLRELLESLLGERPSFEVHTPLRERLRDVLAAAASARRDLVTTCKARVELALTAADQTSQAAVRSWEEAERQLARAVAMPALFHEV